MRIEARQRQLDAAIAAQTALIELQRLTGQGLLAHARTAPATATVSTEDRR
jgi:cobalt-zinc-cadmium efflux system outer membrane protein